MKRILLTAAGSPASQNVLQCLRLAPEPFYVVGVDVNRYHLEWGDLDARYEAPYTTDPGYLDWLNSLIEREGIDFVHGQPDGEVKFLAAHADKLKAKTFYPRASVICLAQDKLRAINRWVHAGLRDREPVSVDRADALPPEGYPYWMRATSGAGARGARLVHSPDEAWHWMKLCHALNPGWQFMVEEYLPGTEYAWHSLWYEGNLVCSAAREFVEKPMSQHMGGSGISSSYIVAKSVHEPEVDRVGEASVRALDDRPHGTYGMDLKCDDEGVPRPTECNAGRFKTTSLFLARAGCNMPYLFVLLAIHGMKVLSDLLTPTPHARYNATEPGFYWIRHSDVETALVREGEFRSVALEAAEEAVR